jgi:hypothetical protein
VAVGLHPNTVKHAWHVIPQVFARLRDDALVSNPEAVMAADMIHEHAIRYVTFEKIAEFVDPTEEIPAHYWKPARRGLRRCARQRDGDFGAAGGVIFCGDAAVVALGEGVDDRQSETGATGGAGSGGGGAGTLSTIPFG